MSIFIKYENSDGQEISRQQTFQTDYYTKVFYTDGQRTLVEYYYDQKLDGCGCYLAADEDLPSKLNELSKKYDVIEINREHRFYARYVEYIWEKYVGLVKTAEGKQVLDKHYREIAYQALDLPTGKTTALTKTYYISEEVLKNFSNEDGLPQFGTIEFIYYYAGTPNSYLRVLIKLPGYEHKDYSISEEQNIFSDPYLKGVFSWENNPYYHEAFPLLPNCRII